jgi:N-acetylglutamate synthase-like GNAT family acetyltransferase
MRDSSTLSSLKMGRSTLPFPIEPAGPGDIRALIEMLSKATPDCAPETVWALPWAWRQFAVARTPDGSAIAAAGGLFTLDAGHAEIRGLVVHPAWRGRGLATRLVRLLMRSAAHSGRGLVCVTRKPAFFAQLGFRSTAPTWLGPRRAHEQASEPPRVAMKLHVPSTDPHRGVENIVQVHR